MVCDDVLTVAERVKEEFLSLYNEYGVSEAPERRRADIIDSFWDDIYKAVFKPSAEDVTYNNAKSKLKTYNVQEVEEVCNVYIKLCKRYGGVIKFQQFANLTGIHRSTLWLWNKSNNTDGYIFNLSQNAVDKENNTKIYILNNNNSVDVVYNGNSKYMSGDNTKYLSTMRFDVRKKLRAEMQDSNTNGLSNDTMGHAIRANNEEELGKLYEPKRMLQQATIKAALPASELPKLGNVRQIAQSDDAQ